MTLRGSLLRVRPPGRIRSPLALVIAVMLVVTACGGDSNDTADDGGSETPPTTQAATSSEPASGDNPEPTTTPPADSGGDAGEDDSSDASGPSTATVTLGNETYTFSTEGAVVAQCLTDLFGVFSVQLPMIDDGGSPADGGVQILVLHEGTDPDTVGEVNAVQVSVGDEDWIADEADMMYEQSDVLEPGMGQVDSAEVDGRTVRGTATFFRQNSLFTGEVETITGTFEATCGEERTS